MGEEFDGNYSSCDQVRCFRFVEAFDVEGLVKVEELGDDFFEFDEENLILTGRKTKFMYKIGDELKIQVARIDIELGQIDFVLAGEQEEATEQKQQATRG